MKNKKIFWIILIIIGMFFIVNPSYATNKVVSTQNYKINSNEITKGNPNLDQHNYYFEPMASAYEFFDEKGQYNIVYELNNKEKMAWIKLDKNMKKLSETYIPRYLEMFGNAIYHNGYLYVVYGANDETTTDSSKSDFATAIVIEMVKYDKNGKVIASLPITAKETSIISKDDNSITSISYGAKKPFDAGNCDLAVNKNNIIKCVFGKEMYNGHQMSYAIYVDANTLEYLNRPSKMDYDNKYFRARYSYWISHSFDQRIIATSDGNFLTVDRGDAYKRGFIVSKSYENLDETIFIAYNMFNFREGCNKPYGYNCTYSNLGNIVELSDGYMLIASSEKTLSLNYAKDGNLNEGRNIFVQKYNKDFSNKTNKTIQMLNTEERKSEPSRTDVQDQEKFYLSENGEIDYGVKWLTNYNTNRTVEDTRAIPIENDRVVIIWAEHELVLSNGILLNKGNAKYYYEVIDKNGNVEKGPYEIINAKPSRLINYNYKDGIIYWTEILQGDRNITVHALDVTMPFEDVQKSDWYYNSVKYVYTNNIIQGTTTTTFKPNDKLTRGQLATILWRMAGMPSAKIANRFPDVKSGDYYYEAVRWASEKKVVNGYKDGRFGPNDYVTREQLAAMLRNYAIYKKKNVSKVADISGYKDVKGISSYAVDAVKWAVANKIISGKENGTKIAPKGNASRAEAAAMIEAYCSYVK